MAKKFISALLALILILSAFASIPLSANADEVEIAEVGVRSRTMDQVKEWILNSEGKTYGSGQCVPYCNAYLSELWDNNTIDANARDWKDRCPYGWTVVDLQGSFFNCRLGDIIVEDYYPYGHVCIYWGYENGYHRVYDQNYRDILKVQKHEFWYPFSQPTYCFRPPISTGPPTNAKLTIDKTEVFTGDSINFYLSADNANGTYTVGIDRDGTRILTKDINANTCVYTPKKAGSYSAYFTCYNDDGLADSNRVYFTVKSMAPPSDAKLMIDKTLIVAGDDITFTVDATNADRYSFNIKKAGNKYKTDSFSKNSYSCKFPDAGEYSAFVTCYNDFGSVETNSVNFTVEKEIANVSIKADKTDVYEGADVDFTFSADNADKAFMFYIYGNDGQVYEREVKGNSISYSFSEPGDFRAYVIARTSIQELKSNTITIKVRERKTITESMIKVGKWKAINDTYHEPEVVILYPVSSVLSSNTQYIELEKNRDYIVSRTSGYEAPILIGTKQLWRDNPSLEDEMGQNYSATVTGIGEYKGSVTLYERKALSSAMIFTRGWTKTNLYNEPQVDLYDGTKLLVNGVDYSTQVVKRTMTGWVGGEPPTKYSLVVIGTGDYYGKLYVDCETVAPVAGTISGTVSGFFTCGTDITVGLYKKSSSSARPAVFDLLSKISSVTVKEDQPYYTFENVDPGTYTLKVTKTGCEAYEAVITVNGDQEHDVVLTPVYSGDSEWYGMWKASDGESLYIYSVSDTGLSLVFNKYSEAGNYMNEDYEMEFDTPDKTIASEIGGKEDHGGWEYYFILDDGFITVKSRYPDKAFYKEITKKLILGDADGDGTVTILDATAIQRHLAELPTKAFHEEPADADEDGTVTILDAATIQRHLASLPTNNRIGTLI